MVHSTTCWLAAWATATFVCIATSAAPLPELFSEELLLQPVPGSLVAAHLHLQVEGALGSSHVLFPRVVHQLYAVTNVLEFHLALTQGRWHARRWGRAPLPAAPAGAQLRARFRPGLSQEAEQSSWGALAHGLSGIFCGSLNFLDAEEHITAPAFAFGSSAGSEESRSDWTYGTLPREALCTENLTPWLRLLPCRGAAGLSALLHGPAVFLSPYTSLTASLTASTAADGSTRLRLAQTLTLLLPVEADGRWSLRSLFGDDAKGACPLAARSDVHVKLPWDSANLPGSIDQTAQQLGLSPAPARARQDGGHVTGRGEERSRILLQVDLETALWDSPSPSQLHAAAARQGTSGAVTINTSGTSSTQLCIFQVVPWWAQLWLHTLRLRYDGQAIAPEAAIARRRIMPGESRTSPAQLELCMAVHRGTTSLSLSIDFQKAFMTVFEHPPDASRGLDLPATVVTLLPAGGHVGRTTAPDQGSPLFQHQQAQLQTQVTSEGAVVQLAQPDFSMPYNVCCLTSTVLAVFLGAMLNALLRREAPQLSQQQEAAASRRRKLRVALLIVAFAGAAVYLDKGLQASLRQQLVVLTGS